MVLVHQKLIWLVALIAVFIAFAKIKSGYFIYRSKALRIMTYGCGLLIFGNLIGLAGYMGIFGAGYSKSIIFFVFESVIGYIGGWTMLIWGMSLWLPYLFSVSSRLQKKNKSVKLYESISRVSAYGDASPSTFSKIAASVIDTYGFQAASLHVLGKDNRLSLFASVGLTDESKKFIGAVENSLYDKVFQTGEIYQADENIKIHKDIIIETVEGLVVDALAMPVDFGIKKVGVLTIYTNHPRVFSQEELQIFEAFCVNLGLAFYRSGLQRSINLHKSFSDFISVMLKTARSEDNLNSRVIRLAKLFKQYMTFNTINLYLYGNGAPHLLDFNLQNGGKVIIEKGYYSKDNFHPVRWVMQNNRGLTLPDNEKLINAEYKTPGIMDMLYTPVVIGGKTIGVLSLSVNSAHKFNNKDMIALDAFASVISGSVLEELNADLSAETFRKIGAVKYSLEAALDQEYSDEIYREIAKIITENTPSTFCRIMLLDNDRKTFHTAAIYQRREMVWDERTIASIPAAELYTHKKAIAQGKPIIVGHKEDKQIFSELESKLLLPEGISQCMIIPIIVDSKSVGVVTIGESRKANRNRFDSETMVFAVMLTNIISMYLWQKENIATRNILANSNRIANKRLNEMQNQADVFRMITGFNSRINGPLAGIMASCEYLKTMPLANKKELDKYISSINKNAVKIHKLSSQFAEAKESIETILER
ncbi:MAG: GAF domain-containing protein [candidate division Zixibacteria bacterium]|nr:GAF domain-containing protein [candidate division Zixibacteria bacterium]